MARLVPLGRSHSLGATFSTSSSMKAQQQNISVMSSNCTLILSHSLTLCSMPPQPLDTWLLHNILRFSFLCFHTSKKYTQSHSRIQLQPNPSLGLRKKDDDGEAKSDDMNLGKGNYGKNVNEVNRDFFSLPTGRNRKWGKRPPTRCIRIWWIWARK